MKGDSKVIEYLNRGLRSELTAISQYWLHYRLLDNWGLGTLARKWREESVEGNAACDRFVDRILFLEGTQHASAGPARKLARTSPSAGGGSQGRSRGARALSGGRSHCSRS